jgi:N-acetylmuramoyl-L-alanine amidase
MLLLLAILPGSAFALSVDQVRFGAHPDKIRLVLDLSEASDFRAFVLDDPYRLVIDLPDFQWRAGNVPNAPNAPDARVTAMRHGNLEPGVARIVFDMNVPVGVRTAFLLPAQDAKPHRLVVDFAEIPASSLAQEKNRVHGTLTAGERTLSNAMPAPSAASYQIAGASSAAPPVPPLPPRKMKKPLIVIDPGHGGVDPGATGANHVYEKKVTLALAKELKKQLEETGQYNVILTRDTDVFIKLADRVKFARKHEADLFISIHADSMEKKNVSGSSVYTLSEKASDAQTAKLAANENRADLIAGVDLSVEDEEVANILVDLAMRDTMNQSKFFANKLVNTFQNRKLRVLDNPHRYAGFAVLKAPDIPSVLVEAGFMSNPREAELLNSADHRRKLASALRDGINAYFEQVRKNQRI